MKTLIKTLAAIIFMVSQAQANDKVTIQCYFKDQPSFKVTIQAGPFKGFYEAIAPAQILIAGPRLFLPYSTALTKRPISTRIIVGTSYFAKLDQNSSISLKDIDWVPSGFLEKAEFTGVYTKQDKKISLICK